MPMYEVLVTRTTYITFRIEAENATDAEERYLNNADKITSHPGALTVTEVRPA